MLNARVQELSRGEGLDEEEQKERRVLMLARALQFKEADPTPIAIPAVKFTQSPPAAGGEEESTTDAAASTPVSDKPAETAVPAEGTPLSEAPASN
jgi:hypothetical protein